MWKYIGIWIKLSEVWHFKQKSQDWGGLTVNLMEILPLFNMGKFKTQVNFKFTYNCTLTVNGFMLILNRTFNASEQK